MPSTSPSGIQGLGNDTFWQTVAVVQQLERAGLSQDVAARLRSEPEFVKRLVADARQGAIQKTISQHHASLYFTNTFFSPADWWQYVGAPLVYEHLRLVEYFPWPAKIADQRDPFDPTKFIRDTHFAFPMWTTLGPRRHEENVNLRWWFARTRDLLRYANDATEAVPWFFNRHFALEPSFFPRWYLVRLEPPEDSLNLTFAEQRERIPADYEMVPPLVMATAQLLFALGHKYHFYEKAGFGRCGDSDGLRDGDGVVVGATREGVHIQEVNPARLPTLGLHLMRRMPVAPK